MFATYQAAPPAMMIDQIDHVCVARDRPLPHAAGIKGMVRPRPKRQRPILASPSSAGERASSTSLAASISSEPGRSGRCTTLFFFLFFFIYFF
jgi:hypothetical protein